MDIDKALETIFLMIEQDKPESEIIKWVESNQNSTQIFDWFNKFMRGYTKS